jgi:ubiquitin carboxyl-terminal hydrolase 25/28
MCRCCRYHFVFHICPPGHEESTAHLQHHFRVEEAEWRATSEPAVFNPAEQNTLQGRFRYGCTFCGLAVHLEISLPRLKPMWLKLIMDENRVRESLRIAREQDPARYAEIAPEKETHYLTTALSTLNQYLKNILEDDGKGPRKKISCRNKTFLVQFGRDCDHIFRYLGFEEDHADDTGESYWLPPQLSPSEGKTLIGSSRAFYEDVRTEVQSVLADKPNVYGEPVVKPISVPARDQLERALGCDKSHRLFSTLPLQANEAQYFAALGAPDDADDALIKFAYSRQVESDPEQTRVYLEALGMLAARRSEELQMFVFTHQELLAKHERAAKAVPPNAGPVDKAYAHFGLTRACPEQAAYFISVYRTYREQSPAQKSDHRLALLQIGRDRQSQEILNEVFGKPMELPEACQFLRVEPAWPMDSIAVTAQSASSVCPAPPRVSPCSHDKQAN